MGWCATSDPCGMTTFTSLSAPPLFHRLEQLNVADLDHGSEGRQHEQDITGSNRRHRRLT